MIIDVIDLLYSVRILELKQEMVSLELLEYHYFDDILTDMKLIPVQYIAIRIK